MSVQESVRTIKSARLEVRLSVQELEALQQRAAQRGVSVSEFARRALDLYVGASKPEASVEVSGTARWAGAMNRRVEELVGSSKPPSQERERQTRAHRDLGPRGDTIPAPRPPGLPFKCPVCSWRTANSKEHCPKHPGATPRPA